MRFFNNRKCVIDSFFDTLTGRYIVHSHLDPSIKDSLKSIFPATARFSAFYGIARALKAK